MRFDRQTLGLELIYRSLPTHRRVSAVLVIQWARCLAHHLENIQSGDSQYSDGLCLRITARPC